MILLPCLSLHRELRHMEIKVSMTEFTAELENMHYPTGKSAAAYKDRVGTATHAAIDLKNGAAARRRVNKINRRVLPTLTEAIEFADQTGNENIMKGAIFAIKAATPPKAMRNLGVCKAQVYYSALAVTHVVNGLEEIAKMYPKRSSEHSEIRKEARNLQRRIRSATAAAAKLASNVRD